MKEVHDHSFNVNVAEYFRSVEKAILLKEFYGWIKINKDSKRNIHYGVAWTYNSSEALNEKFRYMKAKSIWRWIDELSNEGFICINRFNEKRYDKTNWYAINWVAYAAICEGKYELILDAICEFKKFQRLVFDSQNEKSISQNKKRYSQNEKSISHNEEPIPSLTNSSSSLTNSEAFVENSFSTVTLIDEVDETSVEIHHVPDYFEVKDQLQGISDKDKKLVYEIAKDIPGFFDTEQKKPKEKSAAKKEKVDNPTPIKAMWEIYELQYAKMCGSEKPEFMPKYCQPMKKLYNILEARQIQSGIVPLDKLQPWRDFIEMWGKYLQDHPKETYFTANFNPATFYSQFNTIVAKLKNQPKTTAQKWEQFYRENTQTQ